MRPGLEIRGYRRLAIVVHSGKAKNKDFYEKEFYLSHEVAAR